MLRQGKRITLFLTGVFLFASVLAFAEKPKTVNIYTDAVLPSGQELKAGKYMVSLNAASTEVTFTRGSKVILTAPVKIMDKAEKNPCSQARFDRKGDKQELQEIRLSGENRTIVLTTSGVGAVSPAR